MAWAQAGWALAGAYPEACGVIEVSCTDGGHKLALHGSVHARGSEGGGG